MDSKHTLSITEARKKIFDIAKDVQKTGAHYILTDKGRPKVAIMSIEELESWNETIDILAHHPNIVKDIKQAEKEYQEGKAVPLEEVFAEYGYVLADKGKTSYVASPNRTVRKKKSR